MTSGRETAVSFRVVVDPACGGRAALMAVADRFGDRVRLAGQEIDERAARTAAFNLSGELPWRGVRGSRGRLAARQPAREYLGQAAAVVCEPPFDSTGLAGGRADHAIRAGSSASPRPRDGELAWVQHCYAHLRPRGVAVVAVSQRTCVQPSGEHIRAALVRSGVLRAVDRAAAGHEHGARHGHLPVGAAAARTATRIAAPVRMIDLSGLGDPADVPREFAAWQQLLERARDPARRSRDRATRLELLDEGATCCPPGT